MANRLTQETSPYLLQHAHNPVDWYPWGEEALTRAREEDKPILLSIGYSSCHWCHVMERESFEDPQTASVMNANFVCIKVDREERPDLDSLYMDAVQALTGQGGWPLNVFLAPDGRPFYGGTYFPPEDRQGFPGFRRLLLALAEAYRTRRGDVVKAADTVMARLKEEAQAPVALVTPLSPQLLVDAHRGLADQFDAQHGGFGTSPKFPQPMVLEFLMRLHRRQGAPGAPEMVEKTLTAMARGGIYDQVGGGFHRYATDRQWLVPHFEKMLYDNALLARMYLHAYQATGNAFYRRISEETLDYVLREMTSTQGGFYSAQDADTEGEEGKYYAWSLQEFADVLGPESAELLQAHFGVTRGGNFEGGNILHVVKDAVVLAHERGLSSEEVIRSVHQGKMRLLDARSRRVAPGRDEKVLAAWNGLMLRSMAEAASTFGREDYRRAAENNADFLMRELYRDGRLLRSCTAGRAKTKAFLEDYAGVISGLLATYEMTFRSKWLLHARTLADQMLDLFWDSQRSVFEDTGVDGEALVVRPRNIYDNAVPCGSSLATEVLLRLSSFTGDPRYSAVAAGALRPMQETMSLYPGGCGQWLCALDCYLSTAKEIVVIGSPEDPRTRALLDVVYGCYLPNRVIVGTGAEAGAGLDGVPLLQGKPLNPENPTAYVCENFACQKPVTTPAELAALLG